MHPKTYQAEIEQYNQEKERTAKELAEKEKLEKEEMERIAAELADQRAKKDAKLEADYKKSLGDFPNGATKRLANKAGVQRYAAYKLLNNSEVINEYCDFIKNAYAIENEKNRQMDLTSASTKQSEIEKEFEFKQIKLTSDFNKKVGLRQFEYVEMSIAGYWNAYCRANEHGWQVFTHDMAVEVDEDDVDNAVKGIRAFYNFELNNNTSHFFNSKKYGSGSCEWKNYNNLKIVGCRLRSFTATSNWDMFLIGKLDNGSIAASPINGKTGTHVSMSGVSPSLSSRAAARTYMEAYDEPKIYLAKFADQQLAVREIRQLFVE